MEHIRRYIPKIKKWILIKFKELNGELLKQERKNKNWYMATPIQDNANQYDGESSQVYILLPFYIYIYIYSILGDNHASAK